MLVLTLQQSAEGALNTVFQAPTALQGWGRFLEAWFGFSDWRLLIRLTLSMSVAVLLASAMAFHPRTYGRARTVAELEHPAPLLLYAVIGAVVAQIVAVQPAMAFVVFGIGGLLRFRTNVGEADDTGQVILVTIVGVACGLHLFPLAVLATLGGWILLYYLKATIACSFSVRDVGPDELEAVADQIRIALARLGFTIVSESTNTQKGRVDVLAKGPASVSHVAIEQSIREDGARAPLDFEWDD